MTARSWRPLSGIQSRLSATTDDSDNQNHDARCRDADCRHCFERPPRPGPIVRPAWPRNRPRSARATIPTTKKARSAGAHRGRLADGIGRRGAAAITDDRLVGDFGSTIPADHQRSDSTPTAPAGCANRPRPVRLSGDHHRTASRAVVAMAARLRCRLLAVPAPVGLRGLPPRAPGMGTGGAARPGGGPPTP